VPTTLVGLVLFVVLLAPGLTFVVRRAVTQPVQKLSVLRETAGLVLRSLVCDALTLLLFGGIRAVAPKSTPDAGALVEPDSLYLRQHYYYVLLWAGGLLLMACVMALTAARLQTTAAVGRITGSRPVRWLVPEASVTTEPAWWVLFNAQPASRCYVGCTLDDGTYLAGFLYTYSPDSDETADRELTLTGPIEYRVAGSASAVELSVGAIAISARKIQYLTVSYLPVPTPTT